jgi:SAM-dependent methyltransferase
VSSQVPRPTDAAGTEHLERMLTGEEYVKQITSSESDRLARAAFRNLVLRIAPPGAALFDFGAGTGLDARFFAEHGFTIEAYDVDPRMREFFAGYCRDLMDAGRVTLDCRGYREFLTREPPTTGRRADLIVSNFAPLNLVDDPHELFAKFHALTAPGGKVLASVLNPCFVGDMRLRWWRRSALRLWRTGYFFMPGPQAPHYRRRLTNFSALSAPYFRVARIFRGLPSVPWQKQEQQLPQGVDFRRGRHLAWLHTITSRYVFLLFERGD